MAFTGRLITPAQFGQHYIYEVSNSSGRVIRTGVSPRILESYSKFILDYVTDADNPAVTDLWDLTRIYQNSPPRTIIVEIWLDGKRQTQDKPRVQDGM